MRKEKSEFVERLENQLMKFIDRVVENEDAAPEEVDALPKVASVLVALEQLP